MTGTAAIPACPLCGAPAADKYRPFCSQRCADADLHGWLTGRYAIPVRDDDEDAGDGGDERDIPGQGGPGTL